MQITRSSVDTAKGGADWFTGDVYIDAVAAAPSPSRVTASRRGGNTIPMPADGRMSRAAGRSDESRSRWARTSRPTVPTGVRPRTGDLSGPSWATGQTPQRAPPGPPRLVRPPQPRPPLGAPSVLDRATRQPGRGDSAASWRYRPQHHARVNRSRRTSPLWSRAPASEYRPDPPSTCSIGNGRRRPWPTPPVSAEARHGSGMAVHRARTRAGFGAASKPPPPVGRTGRHRRRRRAGSRGASRERRPPRQHLVPAHRTAARPDAAHHRVRRPSCPRPSHSRLLQQALADPRSLGVRGEPATVEQWSGRANGAADEGVHPAPSALW